MAYYPAANGLAEAFNKTIGKLLKKFVSKSQRDWDDKLGECLWAYRTTVRTPTKATPFSMAYGCKVVLPLEIQIPSLRVILTAEMTNEEKYQLRLQELEALDGQMPTSLIANKALSSSNYQSFQQESQGADFQER